MLILPWAGERDGFYSTFLDKGEENKLNKNKRTPPPPKKKSLLGCMWAFESKFYFLVDKCKKEDASVDRYNLLSVWSWSVFPH